MTAEVALIVAIVLIGLVAGITLVVVLLSSRRRREHAGQADPGADPDGRRPV